MYQQSTKQKIQLIKVFGFGKGVGFGFGLDLYS